MAKFLPFVVEKSTPMHVFQTLITRSKGMNEVLVASILYLVVEKGITKIRETASKLPDMDLDKLYETLMTQYPSYRITNEQFSKMQLISEHVEMWYPDKVSAELNEYNLADRMSFLLVMMLVGKLSDYTSLHFELLYTDDANDILNNLVKTKLFSNEGEDYYFKSKDDLKAFVWCHELLLDSPDEKGTNPVCAVYYPVVKGKKSKPNAKRNKSSRNFGYDGTEQYKEAQEHRAPFESKTTADAWDKMPEPDPRAAPDFDDQKVPWDNETKTVPQAPPKPRKRKKKKVDSEPRQKEGYEFPGRHPDET